MKRRPVWEREEVLGAVARLLESARGGRGGTLLVVGEAGLGKSTILDHARRLARMRVGWAGGDALEASLPFGVLVQALEGVGGRAAVDEIVGVGPARDVEDRRAFVFQTALRMLEGLRGPALLAFDDLHFADPDSRAFVAFLARRVSSLPIALIAALRPWPPEAHQVALALAGSGAATIHRLVPLSEEAARRLLAERAVEPEPETARRAWRVCGGNPLLLEQVALALARGERLPRGGAESVPAGQLLLARFGGLSGDELRWARAAAVFGTRFWPGLVHSLARLDPAGGDAALEALSRSGLVRPAAEAAVEFAHPLFRQALYDDISGAVLTRMHAHAFALLADRGRDTEAAEHARPADLAGDERAVAVLERVGRAALRMGAIERATERLEDAARLAGDRAAPALLLDLGDALFRTGRADEAAAVYERVLADHSLDPALETRTRWALARALSRAGSRIAEAERRFEEAAAGTGDPQRAVAALLEHATVSWLTAGPVLGARLARRAGDLARSADVHTRGRADVVRGFLELLTGDGSGVEAAAAAAVAAERDPPGDLQAAAWTVGTLGIYGHLATLIERFEEAERALGAAIGAAEQAGAGVVPALLCIQAPARLRRGRPHEALALAERAIELAGQVPRIRGHASLHRTHALLLVGRLDEAGEAGDRIERLARERGERYLLLGACWLRGVRLLEAGEPAIAAEAFAEVEEISGEMGVGEPCMLPWARHAMAAYAGCGLAADVERVLEWLERCAAGLPCRWPRIAAACGRALLAERAGDPETADGEYQRALVLHAGIVLPLEEAETLLAYGGFLRRRGRPREARGPLSRALALADGCGADLLAARARSELRLAGGRRRSRTEPERLTPAEERVARLAAAGRTNREIAAELVVSVRTVETHLQRVYTKLGVRSRRDLIRRQLAASEDQ